MKSTPAPTPSRFNFQCSGFSVGGGCWVSVHSEMKSARIWDLMAYRGHNSSSNSPSLTDHLTMRPMVS
jgi:hypothetical protein